MKISPKKGFSYTGAVPSDKSITHRAVLLNAMAEGEAVITNPLLSLDTLATIECVRRLGARVTVEEDRVRVAGAAAWQDGELLPCENSGTTMRILTGALAGRGTAAVLDGDASLRRRPMDRVVKPLSALGADIETTEGGAPLTVRPAPLRGAEVRLEVPSAQVKSALLLAGLGARGETTVRCAATTRDHTERMLRALGADIECGPGFVRVAPSRLVAQDITVCGDISSAAFVLARAAIGGEARVTGVGLNPTRAGVLEALERFGVKAEVSNRTEVCGEPVGDVYVAQSELHPAELSGPLIANIIDELPVLAVLACFAKGKTVIRDAAELRVKESDRIALLARNLAGLGVRVTELPDGLVIGGEGEIPGNERFCCETAGDHRIAMSMAVAALSARRGCEVADFGCVNVSFPTFADIMELA